MQPKYDLLSIECLANPYPTYRQLQLNDPVHLDHFMGCWLITKYSDVVAAFANPHLSSERIKEGRLRGKEWEKLRPLFQIVSKQMLFLDPPAHTRLRAIVNKAFTPRSIEVMHPNIESIVNKLLESAVKDTESMDVIRDIAYPLPVTIIAEMLGVPAEDHHLLKKWSYDFAVFMGNPSMQEKSKIALQSMYAFTDYFRYIISQRRSKPKNDLLTALIMAEEQGRMLNEEELIANCVLLLFAGHENMTNLIGNSMLALLQNPDQMECLKKDMSLLPTALEELLRYDSPTQGTGRVVKENTEIGGKLLGKGQGVMLMVGAANRDPDQFTEPARLNLTRRDNRHLSFGHHRHFCIGAALARLEGQIAIRMILQRFPSLKIKSETLEWRDNFAFRGLKSLHVTF